MAARNPALFFIILTVVIDMLGVGLAWPILPQLVEELSGADFSDSALIYGFLMSGFALVQFFVSPFVGMLSDRYGRRPILLISLFGLGVDYIILALAPNLWWLVVGRILAGLFSATVSTANAYIADITPREGRAAAFGLLGAAFGVGFTLGPLIGGVLGQYDLHYPFWLAAALAFANFILGWFVLPESLPVEKRSAIDIRKANPFSALLYIRRYSSLAILLVALLLTGIAQQGLQGIWVLWTKAQFDWGVAEAGYSLAWVGVCMAFVQGWLVRQVVPIYGERKVMFTGFIISTFAFAALPFVTVGWVVYPGILIHLIGWGCAAPCLTALMSQNVPDTEQGLLQGTMGSVNTIAMILGPLIATGIFAKSVGPDAWIDMPGSYYFFGAILFVIVLGIISRDTRRSRSVEKVEST
ncbi:MFS transporter [Pseudahrensia aquimaris]|uniref:MFS transporter n=1 Tax=Pseudahrensia aquimaris TaxID=744461 RepID=A0ABW3FIW6_9HYPH